MSNPPPPTYPPAPAPRDEEALRAAAAGDHLAETQRAFFTLLFNKYRGSLHRYLSRFVPSDDAADLVQETYVRLLRHGETVQLEAIARSYLFTTATNLARDHHRRSVVRRTEYHVPVEEQDIAETNMSPEEALFGEQMLAIAEQAIAGLPSDTRTIFLLHRFRDRSFEQIAQVMQVSTRTVARKMAQAVERLSSALGAAL
jgi:RNA polymerase sigma-70 factor (ECF subfamily)